jgi:phosphoglycolate phosphatase-like HAD superfamily hydrolase
MLLIVYDFDGTFVCTELALHDAVSGLLTRRGYNISSHDVALYGGSLSSRDKFLALSNQFGWSFNEATIAELSCEHKILKAQIYKRPECRVTFDGIPDAVQKMARFGHTQAICSNGQLASIAEILEENKLLRYMNGGIITPSHFNMPGKPDPEMLDHLLRLNRFSPEDAIIIGDSTADMEAGEKASFAHRIAYINPKTVIDVEKTYALMMQAGATAGFMHHRDLPGVAQFLANQRKHVWQDVPAEILCL